MFISLTLGENLISGRRCDDKTHKPTSSCPRPSFTGTACKRKSTTANQYVTRPHRTAQFLCTNPILRQGKGECPVPYPLNAQLQPSRKLASWGRGAEVDTLVQKVSVKSAQKEAKLLVDKSHQVKYKHYGLNDFLYQKVTY